MTSEAVRAFLFGVAIAAPVGPIALLLIHTELNHRPPAALRAALGVALADLTYALLALERSSSACCKPIRTASASPPLLC